MKVRFWRTARGRKVEPGTCDVDQPASARHFSTPQLNIDLESLAPIRLRLIQCTLKMREAAGWFLTISDQRKYFKVSHVPKSLPFLCDFPSRYLTLLSVEGQIQPSPSCTLFPIFESQHLRRANLPNTPTSPQTLQRIFAEHRLLRDHLPLTHFKTAYSISSPIAQLGRSRKRGCRGPAYSFTQRPRRATQEHLRYRQRSLHFRHHGYRLLQIPGSQTQLPTPYSR